MRTKVDYHWYDAKGSFHDIKLGGRGYYDDEDRFQWEDGYCIINGDMAMRSIGPRGVQGNRISSANPVVAYLLLK